MKVLVLNITAAEGIDATLTGLRRLHRDVDLTIVSATPVASANRTIEAKPFVRDVARALQALRGEQFDYTAIPYRPRFLIDPRYLLTFAVLLLRGHGKRAVLVVSGNAGQLMSPVKAFIFNPFWLWMWGPLLSLAIIVTRPYYLVRQVIANFMLTREDHNDEFVGFGAGKSQGGLVYWLTIVKQARRYGLFGIADNTYFGIPVSVHSFPLAIFALRHLRYRGLIYLSTVLISAGLGWIAIGSAQRKMLWLIPLVLLSTYFIQHIYIGTWEPLAWGLSALACAAALNGWLPIAAILLPATLAAHVGVAMMTTLMLLALLLVKPASLSGLIAFGITSFILSLWYVVPFIRSRDKLGRTAQINSVWKGKALRPELAYQAGLYGLFVLVVLLRRPAFISVVLLLLPLVVLLYNEFITWIFSPYTLHTYMLLTGAIFLIMNPALAPLVVYLILIYTSPASMYPGFGGLWGDDLTPVRLGKIRQEILRAFRPLRDGRVAFEHPLNDFSLPYARAAISYIMAAENVDLLNTNFAETGDDHIFQNYVQHLNATAGREEFESACRDAGIRYMVAFTDEFRTVMKSWNYAHRETLWQIPFSAAPEEAKFDVSIFELPWVATSISPPAQLTVAENRLEFNAQAGAQYRLSYSYYRGWRASQNGTQLEILDGNPGMVLRAKKTGLVSLRYSYWNYWR